MAPVEPAQDAIGDPNEQEIGRGIGQREPTGRGEHPRELGQSARRIGVVVERRRAEERVEAAGREREGLGVADEKLDAGQPLGQRLRSLDHRRREIDPDRAPNPGGGGTHRRPAAAADVEETVASLEGENSESLLLRSCVEARAAVTFVPGRPAIEPLPRSRFLRCSARRRIPDDLVARATHARDRPSPAPRSPAARSVPAR